MSFENLRVLNSEQGLSDLAYFITFIKNGQLYGVDSSTPWITVGGSYAGAMSAWFRAKYPHLTVGAIGSSGVVLAVEDFKDFDEQIYQSALKSGPECVAALQDNIRYVEDIVNSDQRLAFQAQFKAEKLTAKEFLFYWADVVVFQFQYSKRVEFCASVANKSREEVFSVVKSIALTVSPVDYGAYYLKNATFAMCFFVYLAKTEGELVPGYTRAALSSAISKRPLQCQATPCDRCSSISISTNSGASTSSGLACGPSSIASTINSED
jgi:hypothetical protein